MLCQNNQTLLHVLNNCPVARDLRRYNARHDAVLSVLASVVQETLSPPTTFTVDIRDQYNFPLHITPTDHRPDMVWWNDTVKLLYLMELTVCFESNFDDAAQRKLSKYTELSEQAKHNGHCWLYKWAPEESLTIRVSRDLPRRLECQENSCHASSKMPPKLP